MRFSERNCTTNLDGLENKMTVEGEKMADINETIQCLENIIYALRYDYIRDGISAVKALTDAIELLKNQKWISVKDRFPSYDELKCERVLVRLENGDVFVTDFDENQEDKDIFGVWQDEFDPHSLGFVDSRWISFEDVTHWMPKPKDPEDE